MKWLFFTLNPVNLTLVCVIHAGQFHARYATGQPFFGKSLRSRNPLWAGTARIEDEDELVGSEPEPNADGAVDVASAERREDHFRSDFGKDVHGDIFKHI